jgi:ankyrin repeat protein
VKITNNMPNMVLFQLEAVNHGFIEIAELLLKYGAMVNVPGYDNITPLHEAVLSNKLEVVKLLLMYGADVEARDVNGMTPRYVIIKLACLAIMYLVVSYICL